jgi:hypothetical protein
LASEWNLYVNELKHGAISLSKQEDELCWSINTTTRILTTKLGYEVKMKENVGNEG